MKAQELRLGNLISIKDLANGYKKIESIIELGVKATRLGPIKVICEYDDIQPIPLTEEWLLKFGFKSDGTWIILRSIHVDLAWFKPANHQHKGNIYIEKDNEISHGVNCEYVHQLQNLYFALTVEELLIKQ